MPRLADFLQTNRHAVVGRWMQKVRANLQSERPLDDVEILDSLHFFLDEVIEGLRAGQGLPLGGKTIAADHGAERQILKRDVSDVMGEYGLFFDAVVDECTARGLPPFEPAEYAALARVLNAGAAEAVRSYAALRDTELRRQSWEHFAFLAHEIRNPLQTARLALTLARSGGGAERALGSVERSLAQLSEVLDHALVNARMRGLGSGAELHRENIALDELLSFAAEDGAPDAEARGIRIELAAAPGRISADARVLRSAVANLVHNAIKFTRSHGRVQVRGRPGLIEVEDECGGLEPGDEERIFQTFRQAGSDRSGFGLGLAIAREAVQAHGGEISVRNLPGKGCVFAVKLPT